MFPCVCGSPRSSFTAHGLQTQQDYVFRVKAVGRAGTSAYSQQSPPVRVRAAIREYQRGEGSVREIGPDSQR